MASKFFWRKYAHPFNLLLRNHLDSTLIVRKSQKANLQKKHARGGGRPLPELLFYAFLALLAFEVCLLNGIERLLAQVEPVLFQRPTVVRTFLTLGGPESRAKPHANSAALPTELPPIVHQ